MSEEIGLAVVFTYIPSEDRCYHTPFREEEDCPDPLNRAHVFRDSEEAAGDFPGSLWCVAGNERATRIRAKRLLINLLGITEEEAEEALTDKPREDTCPVCGTTPNIKCCEFGRDL